MSVTTDPFSTLLIAYDVGNGPPLTFFFVFCSHFCVYERRYESSEIFYRRETRISTITYFFILVYENEIKYKLFYLYYCYCDKHGSCLRVWFFRFAAACQTRSATCTLLQLDHTEWGLSTTFKRTLLYVDPSGK